MEKPTKNPLSARSIPGDLSVSKWDRVWAVVNGGLAGFALVTIGGTAILLAYMLVVGGGSGAGWGGIGVGMAIASLLSALVASLITLFPLSVWLMLISRRLWRGDSRGRQQLMWFAWIVAGMTLLLGVYSWLLAREPIMYVFFGILPAIYASLHLLSLRPSRSSITMSSILMGTILLSIGAGLAGQMAFANQGSIHCGIENGVTLLTTTGDVVCIGSESAPATRENVIMVWKFDTGERLVRQPFPRIDRYDQDQAGNILAAIGEADPGHFADLLVVDIPSGKQRVRIPQVIKSGNCQALKLSPAGDLAAVVWGPGKVDIYSLPGGQLVRSFQAQKTYSQGALQLAFDPLGEFVAVATVADIALWSVTNAEETPRWQLAATPFCVSFDAEASRMIVFTDGELFSVDLATGQILSRYSQPRSDLSSICANGFSSDGRHFGLVRSDGEVTLWDTGTGESRVFSIGGKVGHASSAINLDRMKMVAGPSTPGLVWLARWDLILAKKMRSFD